MIVFRYTVPPGIPVLGLTLLSLTVLYIGENGNFLVEWKDWMGFGSGVKK